MNRFNRYSTAVDNMAKDRSISILQRLIIWPRLVSILCHRKTQQHVLKTLSGISTKPTRAWY